ncbi:hypothetical protein QAD02_013938 [Eretmocerus hayati]|uniref:Uncharacterized protein n=1 Tax=Eretmocerus hayati TaxID=131215 RepID=A0ACC2P550_9HYME|nr:hypothetical protein QAD02_013938 [Eretmocerus hayati]
MGPRVRISDIPSNPLNGPVHQPRSVTPRISTQIPNNSLESNYVYQIVLRTWDGNIELKKQENIQKNIQENESRVVDVQNGAAVNDDSYEDDCDSSEDDCESIFDAYETEITDESDTNVICSLVMQYEVRNHRYLPTKEQSNWIRDQLCQVFPQQNKSAWIGVNEYGVMKVRFINKLEKLRRVATKWGLWENPNQRANVGTLGETRSHFPGSFIRFRDMYYCQKLQFAVESYVTRSAK